MSNNLKDDNLKKISKLIKFINLTETKYATYDREELMDILDISETTFYRYLKQLNNEVEVPIKYDRKTKGYKIRQDYYMKPPQLTLSETLALVVSSNSILNNSQLPYYEETNMAITKIIASLPDNMTDLLSGFEDKIDFSLNSLVDYGECRDIFNKLRDAIQNETNVWMQYYSYNKDKISERVVSPYILNFKKGFLYLIAYCHKRNDTRMFRLDRIKKMKVTKDKFKYPDDFSLKEYLGNAWGVMRSGDDVEVKIKFTGDIARWIKDNNYHPTQEVEELEGDSVLMSFVTCSLNEVKGWVMKYGANAEVLEPQSLRDEIKEDIERMNQVYNK
ncbi:putative transcriptional regulator [Halobacteroides halobius DSM 5150]|uniref:Putative transcriptional regulator n=1 Tax=Halobacteroides halobius (strain ATCC 35273 / DSM 5150 / MD-1) TaxID=748449 RepID=L0K6N0_HALHC|nr:WYL domain-containing protein [Halobacteroides halobius]AGB40917.1 putative transcriptional regulator [Halobacteroides halobius DSM 5150]